MATLLFYARFAHAGLFNDIWKFIAGSDAEAREESSMAAISLPLLGSQPKTNGAAESSLQTVQDSALVASRNPAGTLPSSSADKILVYTVQVGDTPGGIANRFGISLNTLLWANNIKKANLIKVGDELVILPVTGVQYEVKKGDTIDSIAKKYKGDTNEILAFNGLAIGEALTVGQDIIIPDGEFTPTPASSKSAVSSSALSRFANLPEQIGYYLRPIIGGRNPRATTANPHGLHGFNGVDLSNSCGMPVMASADGAVLIARSTGWNSGFGKYIVIAHPNGTQTLYAHLSSILVSAGQSVDQGTQIGTIGSTGNSTGCHVHFEIRGAKNPF